jgi:hypothetical protein
VIELARFFEGQFDHALGARGEDHLLLDGLAAAADDRFNLLTDLGKIDTERLEHFRRKAFALGDDPQENVLGPDVIVTEPLRLFLGEHNAAARTLGKRFPHRHIGFELPERTPRSCAPDTRQTGGYRTFIL